MVEVEEVIESMADEEEGASVRIESNSHEASKFVVVNSRIVMRPITKLGLTINSKLATAHSLSDHKFPYISETWTSYPLVIISATNKTEGLRQSFGPYEAIVLICGFVSVWPIRPCAYFFAVKIFKQDLIFS